MRQVEKFVMLSVIDNLWMNHLDAMDNLRQGIGLRGYAQKDPLVEYKNEGYRMFEALMWEVDDQIVHRIYKVQVQNEPAPHEHVHTKQTHTHADGSVHEGAPHKEAVPSQKPRKMVTNTSTNEVSEEPKETEETKENKLGRNDPCWCGSGKKWKKCHYPNAG
jgi:preprotein translocase subunit SecA